VVLSTDQMLEVSHPGTDTAVQLAAYDKALAAAGWKKVGDDAGATRYENAGASIRLSAVRAGETVLVVLAK
jgi:hypothetical protein